MPDSSMLPRDFDAWRRLAATDPKGFEERRRRCIDEAIARAPAARQARLRRLQWRIEQTLRRAGTPVAGCVALSNMMWEAILGEGGFLDALQSDPRRPRARATILPFPRGTPR